jgi:hypothetical protein
MYLCRCIWWMGSQLCFCFKSNLHLDWCFVDFSWKYCVKHKNSNTQDTGNVCHAAVFQVSISSMFYPQIFRTNFLPKPKRNLKKLPKKTFVWKILTYNIDEIDASPWISSSISDTFSEISSFHQELHNDNKKEETTLEKRIFLFSIAQLKSVTQKISTSLYECCGNADLIKATVIIVLI